MNESITVGNKCYFSLVSMLKSKLLLRNTKIIISLYKVLVRPIILHACGVWLLTKGDEKKLVKCEIKIMCRLF